MRPSILYRHEHEPRGRVASIKREDFSCYNYVFYITTLTYRVIKLNRKELYDFYYTAITLTTGYKPYIHA